MSKPVATLTIIPATWLVYATRANLSRLSSTRTIATFRNRKKLTRSKRLVIYPAKGRLTYGPQMSAGTTLSTTA